LSKQATVVTSETLSQFIQSGGKVPAKEPDPTPEETKAEEVAPEEKDEDAEQSQEQKKRSMLDDLREERAKRREAQQEAEARKRELEALREQLARLETPPAIVVDEKPVRAKFATDEDFMEALADWQADRKLAEREVERIAAEQQRLNDEMVEVWNANVSAFQREHEDYQDTIDACRLQFPRELLSEIPALDNGPAVAYYLTKPENADEAKRIIDAFRRDLSLRRVPTKGLRELGKLDDRLGEKKDAAVTAPKKAEVSKAPPPMEPIKGAAESVPPSKMTYEQYRAHRAKQLAKRH
jgi:DNA repair exonuclease SbcCD ATPase subunit